MSQKGMSALFQRRVSFRRGEVAFENRMGGVPKGGDPATLIEHREPVDGNPTNVGSRSEVEQGGSTLRRLEPGERNADGR